MPTVPPRAAAVLRRADARLATRPARRAVAVLNVLVLLVAIAPFAVWEGFGPTRFEEVELGRRPDPVDVAPDEPLAAPDGTVDDGWDPSQLPFDLSPTTTVTLVFSVGSQGLDADEAARLHVHDVGDRGGDGLTDTMMLVVADAATREVALLSIPRDTWLFDRGHRINATFNRAGLQAFVDDVARTVGLPVHHLVQLNFGAFARMVDAVGGVAMHVDRPLADVPAVLFVPEAGCWRLDGAAALAWSRGRHTLTRDADGDWVTDATASDFGRIARQQRLLGALWDQVRQPGTIGSLPALLTVARDGLVVDDGLGVQQVRDLLAVFGEVASGTVEGHTLPTRGQRIDGAAAQVVDPDAAAPLLTRLRTWPPRPDDVSAATAPALDGADRTVLAAGPALALPGDGRSCTRDVAGALPDPRPHLGGVVASRGGASSEVSAEPTPPSPSPTPDDSPPPSDDATDEGDATPRPSEPSDATPSPGDDPSPAPSPSPTPSESESEDDDEDDGGIRLPWPGGH